MRIDLVLQRQILRLLLPQAGDLLAVQTILDLVEKGKNIAAAAPILVQHRVQIAVPPIAAQRPAQLPLCFQPHALHLPVQLFIVRRTDSGGFLEQAGKIFQVTVANLFGNVLHRAFIAAQQFLRLIHAQLGQIIHEILSGLLFEHGGKVGRVEADRIADVLEPQRFLIMLLDKVLCVR